MGEARQRAGITLMELLAAMAIIGVMVAAAAQPMRLTAVGATAAKTHASQVAGALRRCRRMALMTRVSHELVFEPGDEPAQCQIYRGSDPVGNPVVFSRHCRVEVAGNVQFDLVGRANGAEEVRCSQRDGVGRAWVVRIARATGAATVHWEPEPRRSP